MHSIRSNSSSWRIWAGILAIYAGLSLSTARAQDPPSDAKGPLRIIVFGAHPDDCELEAGGTAARWSKLGHRVKFVSVTNGDIGHHEMAGGILGASRRTDEVKRCAAILGIETEVLDIHDGELLPHPGKPLDHHACKIRENADVVDVRPDQRLSPRSPLHRDPGPGRGLHGDRPELLSRRAGPPKKPCVFLHRGQLQKAEPVRCRRRCAHRLGLGPQGCLHRRARVAVLRMEPLALRSSRRCAQG